MKSAFLMGAHSRVREFTALTLWMATPSIVQSHDSAIVEVSSELSENVREFYVELQAVIY